MDVVLPLLEVWRTPFVRVRQGALQVRHLRARHTVKTGISCGGEYDPLKCMIKGYEPPRKVPEAYMEKMRNWATKNNVKFGKPSEAGASSDVKVEPDKALVAYNPEQVSWGLVNGQWVGSQD